MPRIPAAPLLAGALVLLFAGVTTGAFLTGDRDLARTLAQGLLNIVVAIAGYYFGSSAGSRAKDEAIARALGGSAEPPAGG